MLSRETVTLRRLSVPAAPTIAVLLVLAVAASVLFGSNHLGIDAVVSGFGDGTTASGRVVWGSRIPRTMLGVIVGSALGVAGVVMQGQTRNPLADPGLFGVSAGAGLFVVVAVSAFGALDPFTLVWAGMGGALVATLAVFAITVAGSNTADPVPLALAGSAVSALLTAGISYRILTDRQALEAYRLWIVGSLSGRQTDVAWAVVPFVLVGLALALANSRALDNLSLGVDMAASVGEDIVRARVVGLAAITVLTGAATAAAGPIAFVGLTVPHAVRHLVPGGHRVQITAAAGMGAAILLIADVVGRVTGGTAEVQVGIVLAIVGGPVFVLLACRTRLNAL